jgi:hypothetical protein
MSVARHEHDRQCRHVDEDTGERCITRLCYVNPGPYCFAHAPVRFRRPKPVESVEALMRQADARVSA